MTVENMATTKVENDVNEIDAEHNDTQVWAAMFQKGTQSQQKDKTELEKNMTDESDAVEYGTMDEHTKTM